MQRFQLGEWYEKLEFKCRVSNIGFARIHLHVKEDGVASDVQVQDSSAGGGPAKSRGYQSEEKVSCQDTSKLKRTIQRQTWCHLDPTVTLECGDPLVKMGTLCMTDLP